MYEVIIGRIPKDSERFGKRGTILLGKQYVKMAQTTSLSNEVYMDVARSHIVSIFGKRGGGKCIHGDTLITLDNGLTLPIKELENNNNNIFTLKHDLKIDKSSKTDFYKRQATKLLEIKLRSGKKIKLTPEHPLLTIKGWIPAERLKIKDRLATPRKIQAFGNSILSEEEVKILAYMIAEGQTRCMFFCNYDKKIVNDLANSVKLFNPVLELTQIRENHYKINSRKQHRKVLSYNSIRDEKGRFTRGSSIDIEKSKIRQLLEKHNLYNMHSTKKIISNQILQLPKNLTALFLNRLFSCDGSIYKNKHRETSYTWQISYSSSSETLIRQVHHLLLRFGILSKLREKKTKCNNKIFNSYELVIRTDNVIKFIQEIGFYGEKEEKQKIALREATALNPNVDTIPRELWDFYRPKSWVNSGRELGYKIPKSARSSINYSPSRQKLLQIAESDNSKRIKQLALSDIFWDEIISIEELNGDFIVYDLSVPEYHNFIANDIIVHNSYTLGVMAEGMSSLPKDVSQNISVIMLDTMGIFWTMKYPNKKDEKLLKEWNLEETPFNIQVYTPIGYFKKYKEKGTSDFPFSIKPSELDAFDWCATFGIKQTDELGILIEKIINKLKETNEDYSIEDIINEIRQEQIEDSLKYAAENRFNNALSWGLFSDRGTSLKDLVTGGKVTVIDISCYATIPGAKEIRALVIGLIAEKLFIERMIARKNEEYQSIHETMHYFEKEKMKELDMPMVWLIVDEAHEFLPNKGTTLASKPLITILREGREPGISLILASQQPGKIHTDVITQSDIVLSHRITAKIDVDALSLLMQSYMREGLDEQLDTLPRVNGSAIIFDDVNERIYPIQVRPRLTWHGGEAPVAVFDEEK